VALAVLDEQVAAFYDTKEKRLHIPSAPPPAANSMAAAQTDMVLAHEIEHGLQDQHYPFPDLDKQPDDDRGLALKALYEGDATFVMLAVPEARFHWPFHTHTRSPSRASSTPAPTWSMTPAPSLCGMTRGPISTRLR